MLSWLWGKVEGKVAPLLSSAPFVHPHRHGGGLATSFAVCITDAVWSADQVVAAMYKILHAQFGNSLFTTKL
jgi:hypothetical protein